MEQNYYVQLYNSKITRGVFPFIYDNEKGKDLPQKIAFILLILFLSAHVVDIIGSFLLPHLPLLLRVKLPFSFEHVLRLSTNLMFAYLVWLALGYALKYAIHTIPIKSVKLFIKKHFWQVSFGLLFIWIYICALLSDNHRLAFDGTLYRKEGFYMIARYAVIFLCTYILKDTKRKAILLYLFISVAVLIVIIMLGQYFRWNFVWKHFASASVTGVFANPNHAGYFLTMCTLCAAGLMLSSKKWYMSILFGIVYLVMLYTLIVNDTLGCYLAVLFALAMGVWLFAVGFNKKIYYSVIPLLMFVAISVLVSINPNSTLGTNVIKENLDSLTRDIKKVFSTSESTQEREITISVLGSEVSGQSPLDDVGTYRFGLWRYGLKLLWERPIFGYGPEQLDSHYQKSGLKEPTDRPHNEYLQVALFYGIPGLVFYMFGTLGLLVQMVKNLKDLPAFAVVALVCVVGYLASAFFGNTMYYTMPYFILFLALIAGGLCKNSVA
ncbi:MAG: O-antigen ligase family protein [Clostridiales bacterium]|nr:O-antigen ligase family protein [Clostridiales bacterium]